LLGPRDFKVLVAQTIVAISHAPYREDIGVTSLDVVTGGGSIYRFAAREIDGERTAGGWTNDHYSLTLERVDAANPQDEQTDMAGTVVKRT